MHTEQINPERLRELLDYDSATGWLTWRRDRGTRKVGGKRAGSIHANGGRVVCIDGRLLRESRVVWAHVHGTWPAQQIDHLDNDEQNNRIANLREVSNAVNCQNKRKPPATSTHGHIGASKVGNRWRAQIKVDGKKLYLGLFGTPQEATSAYVAAKRRLHPGNTL